MVLCGSYGHVWLNMVAYGPEWSSGFLGLGFASFTYQVRDEKLPIIYGEVLFGLKWLCLIGGGTWCPKTIRPETMCPGDNPPWRQYAPQTIHPGDNLPQRQPALGDNMPRDNLPRKRHAPETIRPGFEIPYWYLTMLG